MCSKSLLVLILIFISNLAFGQASLSRESTQVSTSTLATARKNSEIDESKYAHPDDFLYEEKTDDTVQEDLSQDYQDQETATQQKQILEQEAAKQQSHETDSSDSL